MRPWNGSEFGSSLFGGGRLDINPEDLKLFPITSINLRREIPNEILSASRIWCFEPGFCSHVPPQAVTGSCSTGLYYGKSSEHDRLRSHLYHPSATPLKLHQCHNVANPNPGVRAGPVHALY